jgi:hypothetical protein
MTATEEMTAEAVISAIEAAFDGVRRGELTIHEADLLDHAFVSDAEWRAARLKDSEVRWQDVPAEAICDCVYALSYLDPVSWRFYIPAHMRWSVEHLFDRESDPVERTIYTLGGTDAWTRERYQLLSQQQSEAVLAFLEFVSAHPDDANAVLATEGIDRYWGRFRDPDRG